MLPLSSRPVIAGLLALGLATTLLAGTGSVDAQAVPGRAPCSAGNVSLTFDDGPSAHTPGLVRSLRELRVPATFFMVGQRVAAEPATARLVSRSGFLVANHSHAHAAMTRQSDREITRTLRSTHRLLTRVGARPTRLMRPPYGATDARVEAAIARSGHRSVLWDVDPRDWDGSAAATIAARILAQLRPHRSNVVLQHDGIHNSPASIAAVPRVVNEARRRGYCFVALDDAGQPGFPVPRLSVSTTDAREGEKATVRLRLDRPTARVTTVRVLTRGASAQGGRDFDSRRTVVRFPAGSTRRTLRIRLLRDGLDEPGEMFTVAVDRPRGLHLPDQSQLKVRITDRDREPALAAVDLTVEEPLTDQQVPVTVRLGRPSGRRISLVVATVAGTADEGDYVALRQRIEVPAGTTQVSVPVTVRSDTEVEEDETFVLRIIRARFARILKADAVVTISGQAAEERRGRR
ncbi:polysaccharide deacetylase family protein [Nocardioides sp.]|uniref:polysaccharide deacetylase family protein n=1 Tax=Nocardioides sp. TaxID=35761 RepID=UPI00356AC611